MLRATVVAALCLVVFFPIVGRAQDTWPCDEKVVFETSPGAICVCHDQVEFNCCCSIEVEVVQGEFELDLYEREVLEGGGCDCLCCYDLEILVSGLDAGEHVVRIWKNSESTAGDELYGTWRVQVEGESEPEVRAAHSGCGGWTSAESATWGTIKALYRD